MGKLLPAPPLKRMQFKTWVKKFKPLDNPGGSSGDFAFETYGEEYEKVKAALRKDPLTVWTMISCEGKEEIASGWHYVNRMVYYITEVPFDEKVDYIVRL